MKENASSEIRDTRQLAVIYENTAMREDAVQFCARLKAEFYLDVGTEKNWWSYGFLSQPGLGGAAARNAANADLVIFATGAKGDLPRDVKLWIEDWLRCRGEREGTLVSITRPDSSEMLPVKEIYLRHVAHRAGMDFLSRTPPTASTMPDSLDSFNDRADCVTATLDEILHKYPISVALPLV